MDFLVGLAAWYACGLLTTVALFYRGWTLGRDIELGWILSFTLLVSWMGPLFTLFLLLVVLDECTGGWDNLMKYKVLKGKKQHDDR